MSAEGDSSALRAIDDLVLLLQLAEGAAQRTLQRLRRSADTLHGAVERLLTAQV